MTLYRTHARRYTLTTQKRAAHVYRHTPMTRKSAHAYRHTLKSAHVYRHTAMTLKTSRVCRHTPMTPKNAHVYRHTAMSPKSAHVHKNYPAYTNTCHQGMGFQIQIQSSGLAFSCSVLRIFPPFLGHFAKKTYEYIEPFHQLSISMFSLKGGSLNS